MEGDNFPWFAKNYLRKRPRYSSTSYPDDQMASTSTCMPSTSSASNEREQFEDILIEPTDEQLLEWQERQISKCIVDNTLNRVVETYITFWDEENANSGGRRNELEREAQLVSIHANRAQESFEDSAIMWAIDQHGLQQHSHQLFNDNRTETLSTSSSSISLSSPPHLASQEDSCHFTTANDIKQDANSDDVNTPAENLHKGHSGESSTESKIEPSQQSEQKSDDQPNELPNEPNHFHSACMSDEHFDFLEAAVSAAIQEKGLTSYTMQKSPNR